MHDRTHAARAATDAAAPPTILPYFGFLGFRFHDVTQPKAYLAELLAAVVFASDRKGIAICGSEPDRHRRLGLTLSEFIMPGQGVEAHSAGAVIWPKKFHRSRSRLVLVGVHLRVVGSKSWLTVDH
jgi:hypothetical protein